MKNGKWKCPAFDPQTRDFAFYVKRSGMTLATIERKSGVGRQTLHRLCGRIESGRERYWPNAATKYMVARTLGLELVLREKGSNE